MKQLSSSSTTWYKIGFPSIWLSAFGIASIVMLFNAGRKDLPPEFPIIFPCFWVFGLCLCSILCFPLKHVGLAGSILKVRGLKEEIEIPLSEVVSVSGTFMQNPETITLRLKHSSIFGSKIKFMPSHRFFRFTPHPTLVFLRELIKTEANQAPHPTTL